MEKIKTFFKYIFSNEFLLKALIVFAIITLARGEFEILIRHSGHIDIGNAFDLKIKSEN